MSVNLEQISKTASDLEGLLVNYRHKAVHAADTPEYLHEEKSHARLVHALLEEGLTIEHVETFGKLLFV